MAVTIVKKFHSGKNSYFLPAQGNLASKDLLKIVFTSTNMPDDSTAGTRSHTQPGGKYLGTWYETHDIIHKASENQDYPEYPYDNSESIFKTFTLLSGTLNLQQGATATFWHNYKNIPQKDATTYTWNYKVGFMGETTRSGTGDVWSEHGKAYFHYDKDTYGYIDSYSFGTATISGVEVNTVDVTFGYMVGSAVLSGTLDIPAPVLSGVDYSVDRSWPGDKIYNKTEYYQSRITETENWYLTQNNSVVFEVTFGEAYDCRLTAWDDDTHSTTENKILDEEHYKVDATPYRYILNQYAWGGTSYNYYTFEGSDCFVYPPVSNQVLKGNEKYYGDFDLIYATSQKGECLMFKPRLHNMDDSFTAGNYDFVTTLHYQYT